MEPLFQIGGLASGLDTQAIISQLINIERTPIRRLQARKDELSRLDNAFQSVSSRLSTLRTALDDLRHLSDWSSFATVSSSNESVVTATVTGSAVEQSSLSFTVQSLASSHRVAMSGTFTDPTNDTVGAGTFELQDGSGGTLLSITTTATTTLRDLAAQIDAAGVGVDAQVLNTDGTNFQLVLSATSTGADGQFSVTQSPASLGTASVIATGTDAHLKVGTLDVYRSTNTISDLLDGVTLDLKSVSTASEVTISTGRDVDAAVEAVQTLVDAVNGVLSEIATLSSYNADADVAGPLQGDPTVRSLALKLRSAISGTIDSLSGSFTYAGSVGLSLTREGTVSLDAAKLRTALQSDFEGVTAVFAQNLSATDTRVSFGYAADGTASGTYGVVATQAATVASVTGATYSPPSGSPKVFTVTADDGTQVSITIDDGMTLSAAVARINAELAAANINTVTAEESGGALKLSESRYGSHSFTVAGYGVDLDGTYTGQDVAGTIDGVAATGSGRALTATSGAAAGLQLTITATDAEVSAAGGSLDLGTVTYSSGIGGALDALLEQFEGIDGSIQRARDTISGQQRSYDDQIDAFEIRVELRERTIRHQFTTLETTLGQLQSQGTWLAGQLTSLLANQAR